MDVVAREQPPIEVASAALQPRRITLREYELLHDAGCFVDQRVELIDGVIVAMSPIGDLHDALVRRLARRFMVALDPSIAVGTQGPYQVSNSTVPQPDIVVAAEPTTPSRLRDALLIIEVAVTSLAYDLGDKARLYAAAGVPEYWVIDGEGRQIVVHTEPRDGAYTQIAQLGERDVARCGARPELAVCFLDLLPS